jgi:hypothetical protein
MEVLLDIFATFFATLFVVAVDAIAALMTFKNCRLLNSMDRPRDSEGINW